MVRWTTDDDTITMLLRLLQPPTTRRRWGVCGCGVFPDAPCAESPALVACGVDDAGRLEIGRDFAYRYREAGGSLLWYPTRGGHELNDRALRLARAFLAAAASQAACPLWGEDDTRRVLPRARIDVEFQNPLYTAEIAELWQR